MSAMEATAVAVVAEVWSSGKVVSTRHPESRGCSPSSVAMLVGSGWLQGAVVVLAWRGEGEVKVVDNNPAVGTVGGGRCRSFPGSVVVATHVG